MNGKWMRFSSVPIIADMLEAKLVNAPFKDTIKFYFLILKLWKEISKIRSIFFHRCILESIFNFTEFQNYDKFITWINTC